MTITKVNGNINYIEQGNQPSLIMIMIIIVRSSSDLRPQSKATPHSIFDILDSQNDTKQRRQTKQ